MERPLKLLLMFFVAFPLFGGVAATVVLLLAGFAYPSSWLFALMAIPAAYALAYGAAAAAGLFFAAASSCIDLSLRRPRVLAIGAACGAIAVLADVPSSGAWASFAMPVLGAASGAICGWLSTNFTPSNRSLRELLQTTRGGAMLLCAIVVIAILAWRILVFHADA